MFVVMVHAAALVLTYFIFKENGIFFIISEALIIVSAVIAWRLYAQLIQPLKLLMQGVDAIRDRDFNVKFLTTGKHEMDQLIEVYNQMIDELRKERTLQEQQHFFLEKLILTSPTGIIILDYDHRITHINPKALQVLHAEGEAITGQVIDDLANPLFRQIKQLKTGESQVIKLDGISTFKIQKAHFIDRGFQRQFIMIEELTAEILAAEKKVYGKVIRMMAHEVNNTIGPVNSIVQLALNTDPLWESHRFNTLKDALQVAMDRNQNLNLFMRNFAELVKLPVPNLKPVDLHQLIRSVSSLTSIKASEQNISYEFDLSPGEFMLMADEQLLEQALINIVKNAVEAIDGPGKVQFITNAKKKTLIIADTGQGIDPAQSADLFSPFFSTKKDGQGIGLTLVREILIGHGFEFSLKTIEKGRTEFWIRSPL